MNQKVRRQNFRCRTGTDKRILGCIIFALCVACVIGVTWFSHNIPYTPPEYEVSAIVGEPNPTEDFLYGGMDTAYNFRVQMATNLYQQENGSVKVFFTNVEENDVNLMCEIIDEETEKTLYKSGVVRPGEYVESLEPVEKFSNEAKDIMIKIYAFEPEDWYSAGTIEIGSVLQAW